MPLPFEILSDSLGPRDNGLGQLIGKALPDFKPCLRLPDETLSGHFVTLRPYDPSDAEGLFAAFQPDGDRLWAYMPAGPFQTADDLAKAIAHFQIHKGFHTFVVWDNLSQRPVGMASFMRYDLDNGSVEVGMVTFSDLMKRSARSTETIYLMACHAFAHGYRRFEWKCDQLNIPSNRAALRLGFSFEGVFRNAMVVKGRRRDTVWYAMIIEDWPRLKIRLETWLSPDNFDADGAQKSALSAAP